MTANPRWKTLSEGLTASIPDDFRVTHALFTTYALEPAFFEENILPLILPQPACGLSLHAAVRKLQLEAQLRVQPVPIDVYFDARVAVPGVPWLPYTLHPVSLPGGEFHGKVVLLRLDATTGRARTRWLLGAGSANLTKAGWWENQEVWHFCEPFDPKSPPGGLGFGLQQLLRFLGRHALRAPGRETATDTFRRDFRGVTVREPGRHGARFGAFFPGAVFLKWLTDHCPPHAERALEIVSPYFAQSQHAELVHTLCKASGTSQAMVWLPHDPWEAGLKAVRVKKEQFTKLGAAATWSRFVEPGLMRQRQPEAVPRFLHAKVFRVPHVFTFIGSVNFSHHAVHNNFEVGFLFPDAEGPWLAADTSQEDDLRFLDPKVDAKTLDVNIDAVLINAQFDWRDRVLSLQISSPDGVEEGGRFTLFDADGKDVAQGRIGENGGAQLLCKAGDRLPESLRHNTWLSLRMGDRSRLLWVQQLSLEFRPAPAELTPDAWRIIEFWRQLAGGKSGSHPGDYEELDAYLRKKTPDADDDSPPAGSAIDDIFASMAKVHGSFYALQKSLAADPARAAYYFAADRPDTLCNLQHRVDSAVAAGDFSKVDAVEAWVMLNWIQQLCRDYRGSETAGKEARSLQTRAKATLEALEAGALSGAGADWLSWTRAMFLAKANAEATVARGLLRMREKKQQRKKMEHA